MAEWRSNYTPEEDAVILAYAKEAEDEGMTLTTAFFKAADELKRPVKSVTNRHRRLTKALKGEGKGKVKPLSDAEKLVLRLKALSRERERNAEKSELYKDKFEALKGEHEKLKKAYRQLQMEHQTLIDTVNNILGEELDLGGVQSEVS